MTAVTTDRPFDHFIILASMRTGSNFLEANLNRFEGLEGHGELFNPHFVGGPKRTEQFGISISGREAAPLEMIEAMKAQATGLPGFRFFHDHDPRVLRHCLADRRCAKIVLTRNPLESFVSLKIAVRTGQWKMTNLRRQRQAQAEFDGRAFETYLHTLQAFQLEVMHALQVSGQTAFYIDYEDVGDLEVINGLARFLGLDERIEALSRNLKKQNPEPLVDKVVNPQEMQAALARLDRFNLSRTPNFEPRLSPGVHDFQAAKGVGLLFMPVAAGPEAAVSAWLAAVGEGLIEGFGWKTLGQWKRTHPGHRSFSVLRHPVARAHVAYCRRVLGAPNARFREILHKAYDLELPAAPDTPGAHREGFLGFLDFVRKNLSGQTSHRTHRSWASQFSIVQSFAKFAGPDMILREDRLTEGLAFLAQEVGVQAPPLPRDMDEETAGAPFALAEIYDDTVEAAVQQAYIRDYRMLGFQSWRG